MSYYLRSASLTNYVEVARALGLDPYQQLRAAKINRSVLLDPDIRIPAAVVGRLLDASARAAGAEDFGLRMAELREFSNLGPLAFVVREEPTLRRALESMVRYMGLQNESLSMRVEDSDDLVMIRLQVLSEAPGTLRQATDLAVGVVFRMLKLFLGPSWRPRSICFTHPAPASTATYARVFGMAGSFNQDFDGIVCQAADLEAPLPSYDPVMAQQVKQYLGTLLAQSTAATMPDMVRKLVYALLPTGLCSVERVAQHLSVDRRTVHRRLEQAHTSYSDILAEARADLVIRYLENRERPLSEVAALLGFSSLSAFSRWFSGRFGRSVSAWRVQSGQ
ncbi:AraC family transcriptional regulator [Cupriavidus taiwanensis]|uniref:AraC family transcriptional regulator n=1 Tax=Cupriavidus taiwanensis TaxID=164546 RepID=UPI000E11DE16|nr:AraC family transcriptional regulator [Cupriavidus taiwanensis]SOY65062.1 Putative transcription regulator, AraC family [Cupriavidus taiwanensis]